MNMAAKPLKRPWLKLLDDVGDRFFGHGGANQAEIHDRDGAHRDRETDDVGGFDRAGIRRSTRESRVPIDES